MKRYDGYQGTDKAKSAGAVLMFYTTPDAAYTALRDDKLDVIDKMPQVAFKSFKNDLKERAVTQPQLRIQKIHFPMYDKGWSALKDPAKVRQGLSMAINRDDIVKAMFNGDYKSATDWLATGLPGQSDVIGEFGKFDPAKAKALIEEGGGLPGGKMTISYGTDRGDKSWVDAVCSSINQTLGGQPCEGKPYPMFADMRKDATDKKMTSAYSSAWMGDYPFPDNFLADIYKTDAASNDSGYSSEAFDAKAKAAMAAPAEQSLPLWQEAQQEMKKEMPGIPLWYFVTNGGHSTKVSNVQYDLFGRPAWTEITKK
jgi:ABC-type oligopeptide transport system substrate-binding subunit